MSALDGHWALLQVTPRPCLSPSPSLPVEEVDNTLTLIILSVVGGVVGLLVLILLIKKLVTFILKKTQEKK